MRFRLTLAAVGSCLALATAPAYSQPVIDFPDFNDCSTLQLNGDAACTGGVLRLTPALNSQVGSAFSATPIQLGPGASFSSSFQVNLNGGTCGDVDGPGADGLVFVVQTVAPTAIGVGGGSLGYGGIAFSVGVELDTWDNGVGQGDPDGNHVGIDLNGSVFSDQAAGVSPRLNDGAPWFVWVDYDGTTLEVRLDPTSTRPQNPTISTAVDLEALLVTTQAYAGFTAGTGGCSENHDIVNWQLSAYTPLTLADVPTLSAVGFASLALLLALSGWLALRRRSA